MTTPLPFQWNSEVGAMFIDRRYLKLARRTYVDGDVYPLEYNERRSLKSLRHYHASVKDVWDNLTDDARERYPSAEHLRKWALIKCGYHHERSIVCETAGHAKRLAAFIKPMDEYAVVIVKGETIKVFTARSQSAYGPNKMTSEEFKESKNAVLDLLGSLIGVRRTDLEKEAKHK